MCQSGAVVIFEAKTISADNEIGQCRGGLAQLLEYRQDYGLPDDSLCLVVDRALSERRANLLDRRRVATIVASAAEGRRGANPSGERRLDVALRPADETATARSA